MYAIRSYYDKVVNEILPGLDFTETRFIANVCGSTLEDYVEVTRRFEDSPIDAIEINISCPNVKEGGVAFGNDPDMSARVVAACRAVTRKPLITKLSPNQTDIADNARRCIDAGSDAFAVINRITSYNVCYTKLLRASRQIQPAPWQWNVRLFLHQMRSAHHVS